MDIKDKFDKVETSSNARTSSPRQRNEVKKFRYKRGSTKYFLYIQERFLDIYCFIAKSVLYPNLKDNFKQDNLVKSDKNLDEIKKYLKNLMYQKNKNITFSPNSIKIKE